MAVVSAGYADGFDRQNFKKLDVLIDGKPYPVVGNLCMDACFVDVTGGLVNVGDKVQLMWDAQAMAKAFNKCTYEVLTAFNNFRGDVHIK